MNLPIEEVLARIEALKRLDLSTYPLDEIDRLIKFPNNGSMMFRLSPGMTILRARLHQPTEGSFSQVKDVSYKPEEYNTTYQRASTPDETMFYGSFIPPDLEPGELNNARIIGLQEAHPWLRDKTTCGVRRITWGRWTPVSDVDTLAIPYHNKYEGASSLLRDMLAEYNKALDANPAMKESTLAVNRFISSEFAKEQTDNDYDYLISAYIARDAVRQGLDGVMYPSVRVSGKGFNVALAPDAIDRKMRLIAVGEGLVYKRRDHIVADNIKEALIRPGQKAFELKPVDDRYHHGETISLAQFGVSSIDELCK